MKYCPPGPHFLYFEGPDRMVFEYSVGLDEIEDERTHRSASAVLGSLSLCMSGSKSARNKASDNVTGKTTSEPPPNRSQSAKYHRLRRDATKTREFNADQSRCCPGAGPTL
jgi:hypothetical protein